jgi:hypothetical protein
MAGMTLQCPPNAKPEVIVHVKESYFCNLVKKFGFKPVSMTGREFGAE